MYLTYEEYQAFGGKISETDFSRFSYRAKRELDKATFDRLVSKEADENTKRCMFELVEYIADNNGGIAAVSSVSNDGYSVTYAETKTPEKALYGIIYAYFADTDLMYRGTEG